MTNKYSANLTGEPFLGYEMRVVADFLVQGLDKKEIKEKIINENTFQYKTSKSIPKRLSCIFRRLNSLDEFLLNKLSTGDVGDARMISLYAIYRDSFLVQDFINEFIRERFELRQLELKDSDIMNFLNSKSKEHIEINDWTENTIKKIKQIFKNILSGAGLLEGRKISPVLLNYSLREYILNNGDKNFINSLGL